MKRSRPLTVTDWARAGEAMAALAVAALAVELLPVRRVLELAARTRATGTDPAAIADVRRAVAAAARRAPWRAVCFQQGLALHWMLARRGIASELHYGVRRGPDEGVAAHVWVSAGGRDVIGGEEAAGFARLVSCPPGPTR